MSTSRRQEVSKGLRGPPASCPALPTISTTSHGHITARSDSSPCVSLIHPLLFQTTACHPGSLPIHHCHAGEQAERPGALTEARGVDLWDW